ncbi:Myb-like DNA-binding domain-containing protein [Spironucleus salmonicida]|uniref:Myb-like DNA-binding domain-containing protein n=1 Tax=Spironucleus salmonicida TaxID=348837 RepID=V6LKC6_9EUKA|nr:Myb-like DNA-binding domain-containing protein [Spironucleus salmonicida]|eukprot:EST44798.1 Myb-like DNA-binding domain-containing protein [Spironucleus salmonicida]
MIQVRVRPPCWGPDEEQILFNYVEAHVFSTGHIDWTDINNYLPNRTLSQCTSKLHRMRQDTDRFKFRKLGKKNIRDNNTVIQVDVLLAVLQAMK